MSSFSNDVQSESWGSSDKGCTVSYFKQYQDTVQIRSCSIGVFLLRNVGFHHNPSSRLCFSFCISVLYSDCCEGEQLLFFPTQVDPMFQRMASSFDESSTAGVFLSVLFSENSRCELLFPSYMTLLQLNPSYSPPPPQRVPAAPFMSKKHSVFDLHSCFAVTFVARYGIHLDRCSHKIRRFFKKTIPY